MMSWDTDNGFQGKVQFFVGLRDPAMCLISQVQMVLNQIMMLMVQLLLRVPKPLFVKCDTLWSTYSKLQHYHANHLFNMSNAYSDAVHNFQFIIQYLPDGHMDYILMEH